jgi:hypothetical protein
MKRLVLMVSVTLAFNMYAQRGTIPNVTESLATCDQRYSLEMQDTLIKVARILKPNEIQLAQRYMIMVKQKQDLDFQIRQMERKVFDITTIGFLRTPLQKYQRCLDTLISYQVEY